MVVTKLSEKGADLKRLGSDKMRRFVLEYLLLKAAGNDSPQQAAINAGYPKKTAAQQGYKLLRHPIIKAHIGKLERQDIEELELSRHEILLQVWYAATREARDFVDPKTGLMLLPHQLPDCVQNIIDGFEQDIEERFTNDGDTVRTIKMKYKLTPHATAREQWLKHKGLFPSEKVEHGGKIDIGVNWDRMAEVRTIDVEAKDPIQARLDQEEAKTQAHITQQKQIEVGPNPKPKSKSKPKPKLKIKPRIKGK